MTKTELPEPLKPKIHHKETGVVPYFEFDGMDRPEGMTCTELKGLSQYNQKFATNESLAWNDLYGHARVLKNFSGFTGTIDGVVPHGVYSTFVGLSGMELGTGLKNYYSWLSYLDEFAVHQGGYSVTPIAAPFVYAMSTLDYDINHEGKGTIFIPYHSTDLWDFDDDWYHLMLALRKANYPQPLAVMLFFEDVRKGRHRIFLKKGIPVYTCGDKFRPDFLYQFIHIVRHFKYVLINDISTPAFYGAYMGKTIIPHGELGVRYENNQTPWAGNSPDGRAFPQQIYDVFSTPSIEQRWAARTVLRECALQTPEQMKNMFEHKGGVEYAAQEGQVEGYHLSEHPEVDGRGDAAEASCCCGPAQCGCPKEAPEAGQAEADNEKEVTP